MRIEAPESVNDTTDCGVEHPVVTAPPNQEGPPSLESHCQNAGPAIDDRIGRALGGVKLTQTKTPKTTALQPAL